jgi:hypothetical protein
MPRIVFAGRYKGQPYAEVLADRKYCVWVSECPDLPAGLRPFKRWLTSRHGGVMPLEKHRFKLYSEIVEDDPSYCVWASELVSPTDAMQRFQIYLKQHGIDGEAQ